MSAASQLSLNWKRPQGLPTRRAIPVLEAAVARFPDRADLRTKLAEALFDADLIVEARDAIIPAIENPEAEASAWFWFGRIACELGEFDVAADAFRKSATPQTPRVWGHLARALAKAGHTNEALEVGLDALSRNPQCHESFTTVSKILASRNAYHQLYELCVSLRARTTHATSILANEAYAAARLGKSQELHALADRDRWLAEIPLKLGDTFNRNLADEIRSHNRLETAHSSRAAYGDGVRIRALQTAGGPLAQTLLARIREEVESYLFARRRWTEHPLNAHVPQEVELSAWALVLTHDGHERWHMHDASWISGVYYVAVPEAGEGGRIEFGPVRLSGDPENDSLDFPRWSVRPSEGSLLLFPAYYVHRTHPTGVLQPRICVAFDVIPVQEGAEDLQGVSSGAG